MQINKNYKIGLLALCALSILYYGLLFLNGRNIFSKYIEYQVFYSVNKKLAVSASVTFKGHEVGKVTKIELSPKHNYGTLVTIEVDKQYPLTDTSKVMLCNLGNIMMETNALELELCNKGKPLTKHDLIIGQYHPNFSDTDINSLAAQMATIMTNLKTTTESVNSILGNLEKTSHALHAAIHSVQHNINIIANNIVAISTPLADPVEGIPSMLPAIHGILAEIKAIPFSAFSCKATSLLSNVETLLQNISNNHGTLGRLINDATLYNNLNGSVENFNNLLFDVKKRPFHYLNFSLAKFNFNSKKQE